MVVVSVDAKGVPVCVEAVAVGGIDSCYIDIRSMFKNALLSNAVCIVCFHNHLSEDVTPSKEGVAATTQIIKAGEILGIHLADHIIIGFHGIYSMREHGRMGNDDLTERHGGA